VTSPSGVPLQSHVLHTIFTLIQLLNIKKLLRNRFAGYTDPVFKTGIIPFHTVPGIAGVINDRIFFRYRLRNGINTSLIPVWLNKCT
jgi:hypothetical protein